jgi:hypothetical protein
MKFSMTGREKVTFKYKRLLNRGDRMGRFDLIEVTEWAGLTEWTGLTVFINKFELNYDFVFFTFQSVEDFQTQVASVANLILDEFR